MGIRILFRQACRLIPKILATRKFFAVTGIGNAKDSEGWFNISTHKYKFFRIKFNYEEAQKDCKKRGATLATTGIRNNGIRNAIINKLLKPITVFPVYGLWIGLDDLDRNKWIWNDGVQGTTQNIAWAPGEPSDSWEKCGMLNEHLKWQLNDHRCDAKLYYLCEKE
uniref:lectin-like n=1 Tax=Styela clava TaxID=7725 RepID=UPI00193ABA57|nr:lectin-like [Styela clava]